MQLRYTTLDVFTDRIFCGNPLAVFPDGDGIGDRDMQRIARELNLSETVFVLPPRDPGATCRVRIFTPGREVPFAGHPTLGTAFYLVAAGRVPAGPDETVRVVLEEQVGLVPVEVTVAGGRPVSARLTAAVPPTEEPVDLARSDLARIVDLAAADLGAELPGLSRTLGPSNVSTGLPFLVVPVRDQVAVSRARLVSAALDRYLEDDAPSRMVYVVGPAAASSWADLRVRMFAPEWGVPEDPATGSAAAALAGYLGARVGRDGVHAWRLEQGVEMGRPSRLDIEAVVEGGRVREVRVGGSAVIVAQGTMEVPA